MRSSEDEGAVGIAILVQRIQHVGSTAIHYICAKPIIDIVIGIRDLNDISPYMKLLEEQLH